MWEETNKLRKNYWMKRNQDLMILEIVSLSRLQKMQKLRHSLVRKACSREKPKAVASKPFAHISDQKVRAFSHTKSSLKRLNMWLRSPEPSQQKPRIEIGLCRKDLSRASCLTEWISVTYMWDSQGSWGRHTSTQVAPRDWRDGK